MHRFLNHYSFVMIALAALAVTAAATWRIKRRWLRAAIPGALITAFVVAFLRLRTGGGNVHSAADLDRALAAGRPVMLELYSDF